MDQILGDALQTFGSVQVIAVFDEQAGVALDAGPPLADFLPEKPGHMALLASDEPNAAFYPALGIAVGFASAEGVSRLEARPEGQRVPDGICRDTDIHGTHTAGTLCGAQVDGVQIGVAPEASLYSGLVIEGGDALRRVLAGLDWLVEQQVQVLSLSLGFRGYTPFFLAVVRRLRQRGTPPVIAIGNEHKGTSRSPGNYVEALSVGAVDDEGLVPDFSSSIIFEREEQPYQPDLVAPGQYVLSAVPGGGSTYLSGTSMATPHVAGVAALLLSAKPTATIDEVEAAILAGCKPLSGSEPVRWGAGVVDPAAAVAALLK